MLLDWEKKLSATEEGTVPRPRPIKIKLNEKSIVEKAIKNSYKLKGELGDLAIFFKPDKSKAEREEYQRLGKAKMKLMEKYPTVDGEAPKVVLKSGKLLLNGAQVDEYRSTQSLF